MIKTKSKRLYLDANATVPLSGRVCSWLKSGTFIDYFANPSSHHYEGKMARRLIRECEDLIFSEELWGHLKKTHYILFHSGATEGINTLVQGFAKKQKMTFICKDTDHPCVTEQNSGQKNTSDSIILENITWVHNETGFIQELESKNLPPHFIHVDAVQAPGRISLSELKNIPDSIHAVTFSGHKFGAFKGVGFSLIRKDFPWEPLLLGGGQQKGLRSGTENVLGIYSIYLALQDLLESFDEAWIRSCRDELKTKLEELIPDFSPLNKGKIKINANTLSFIYKKEKADVMLAKFDMAGIAVGRGSACSLGQTTFNPVHKALGLTENDSKHVLRLSFPPYWSRDDQKELMARISSIFNFSID